tara:strand:- start:11033 stop:12133 length:1101 start_codon:yes stop_codon:yes gene_type:complete
MRAKSSIKDLALAHMQALHAYVPGKQPRDRDWIKLNTNENPYPPSPAVAEALANLSGDQLRKYPSPISGELRKAVAESFTLPNENWAFVGNGSDEILNLLMRTFCDPERGGGYMVPSYSLYPVLLSIKNAKQIAVRYDDTFVLPIEKIADCGANIFFLTSPNAPTGVGIPTESIRNLAAAFDGVLVVDEAYGAFASENALSLVEEIPNLCVTRTLSKSHSLAGMRIGFLLGNPEMVQLLDKVRDSYNVNVASQAAGLAAISDPEYYNGLVDNIIRTREKFSKQWQFMGWKTYPSESNFLFIRPADSTGTIGPKVALSLFDFLREHKILVRYFGTDPLTDSFLRISVGSDSEMLTLSETIDQWLKSA